MGPRTPLLRARFLYYARGTTRTVLLDLTDNPELIGLLTVQYPNYALPPAQSSFAVHATVVEHYLEGAAYPVAGAGQIAATMVPVIEATGGMVSVRAEVQAILVEGDGAVRVRLVDGRELRAPVVISDAGVANTFGRLLPPDLGPVPVSGRSSRRYPLRPPTSACMWV